MASDPFASSRSKLARAKKDLAKLKRRTAVAVKKQTYEIFSQPAPDKPEFLKCKMRLSKELPDVISEMTGNIVDNLGSAFDHVMDVVAIGSACAHPVSAYFPISNDCTTFETH